jgi:hypothetical protein
MSRFPSDKALPDDAKARPRPPIARTGEHGERDAYPFTAARLPARLARGPSAHLAAINHRRLAALPGRTITVPERALTGLTRQPRPGSRPATRSQPPRVRTACTPYRPTGRCFRHTGACSRELTGNTIPVSFQEPS